MAIARFNNPNSPFYYLRKYKTSQRPRPCDKCRQNAYYWHDYWGWVCASHLLDLVNIGGLYWNWEDYPEVWQRTERLLQREAPPSGTVKYTEPVLEEEDAVMEDDLLDGWNE